MRFGARAMLADLVRFQLSPAAAAAAAAAPASPPPLLLFQNIKMLWGNVQCSLYREVLSSRVAHRFLDGLAL